MKRTRRKRETRDGVGVQWKLTDERDTSIGAHLALLACGTKKRTDDAHADSGGTDTGQQELSAANVVDDRGTGQSTHHGCDTVDQVQFTLTVTVGDTSKTEQDGKEVCGISTDSRGGLEEVCESYSHVIMPFPLN